MKYIKQFESDESDINYDEFKNDIETVFEDKEWLVIKAKSFGAFCYYGQDQEWSDVENDRKYSFNKNTFININKEDERKIVLNFDRGDFYTKDDETIYLKEFLDVNNNLFNFYGRILECSNVIKENEEYWIVVEDYSYFESFFKLDNRTRSDLIKKILDGEEYELFNYDSSDFDLNENLKLDEENLDILKMFFILEKIKNSDNDYDIEDINDYDDVRYIIENYDFDELKSIIKSCICTAHEDADAAAAYEDVTNEIYSFFNLYLGPGSPKWQKNKNKDCLWIKFKSITDAYSAKFIINKYDDSYVDDVIEYYTPYNG